MSALRRPSPRRTRTRRVVAFAGMLTVVAGLVGLRTATTPAPTQALGAPGLATAKAGPTGNVTGAGASTGHHRTATHRHGAAHHHAAQKHSSPSHQVLVGKAFDVSYGIVQVKVRMTGHRITDVTPLSLPQGGRSSDISRYAAPQLRHEALAAQSANIDTVSGASYTSAGYAKSLQSALDQRHG